MKSHKHKVTNNLCKRMKVDKNPENKKNRNMRILVLITRSSSNQEVHIELTIMCLMILFHPGNIKNWKNSIRLHLRISIHRKIKSSS